MADIQPGLRRHYGSAGTGQRVVVLLLGLPTDLASVAGPIPPRADAGFRVVAPECSKRATTMSQLGLHLVADVIERGVDDGT